MNAVEQLKKDAEIAAAVKAVGPLVDDLNRWVQRCGQLGYPPSNVFALLGNAMLQLRPHVDTDLARLVGLTVIYNNGRAFLSPEMCERLDRIEEVLRDG